MFPAPEVTRAYINMKVNDFFVDSLIYEAGEILKQLITLEFLKYYLSRFIKRYAGDKFDDEAITLVVFICIGTPDIELNDIDFFIGSIDFAKQDIFKQHIYKVSEYEILQYYLLKETLTLEEKDILEKYIQLMYEYINGYGISEVIDQVATIIWKERFEKCNELTKQYLMPYICTKERIDDNG